MSDLSNQVSRDNGRAAREPAQQQERTGVSAGAALLRVQHVDRDRWQSSSTLARFLIAARAPVILMTVCSVTVAVLCAFVFSPRAPDAAIVVACYVGLASAHAANNLMNDLVDAALGVDTGNYFRLQYGTHVLQAGLVTRATLYRYCLASLAAALACGMFVLSRTDAWTLVPMGFGAMLLLFYTWPLKKWALGEVAVFLVWGPLMVMGTYYAATSRWDWPAFVVACIAGLGPTLVIFGKHIDKLAFDSAKRIGTLPVRMGDATARHASIVLVAAAYTIAVAGVALGALPLPLLAILLSVPGAATTVRAFRQPAPTAKPATMPDGVWPLWFAAHGFAFNTRFSAALVAGLVVAAIAGP